MSLSLKENKSHLLFVPLGGSNEIGMNFNMYHIDGKWIIVDCGGGFPDDYLPGVDLVVSDTSFVMENKQNIVAVILTHAHEDHVGGIGFLLQEINCPVYTTKFTANFLKDKLKEYSFEHKPQIKQVDQNSSIDIGPFSVQFVALTHSAPEMQALMIRTKVGNIFHTGDWKFDEDPLVGEKNDESLLKTLGDEGVLALVCDSTNVFTESHSGSEGELRKSLEQIIANCPKMVVVTTFASNLARMETVLHAASKAGRKVALVGRSMHRIFRAAQDSGYLLDIKNVIDDREISRYDRSKVLVLATGCQGEPLAAVNKMASKTHPNIRLAKGDTVIFSSKIIPGNDKKIYRMFNTFVRDGIEVITERDHFVHVSGHPSKVELKKMFDLIRPQVVVPVHGEPVHLHEHVKLAKSWGAKHAVEVENGLVVRLDGPNPSGIAKVKSGYMAVDGNFLIPSESSIFKMRRKMREDGIIFVAVTIDAKGTLVGNPLVSAPGCLDLVEDLDILADIQSGLVSAIEDTERFHKNRASSDQLETSIRSVVRRILKEENGKYPQILVEIQQLKSK
jgi:ribonuclease J